MSNKVFYITIGDINSASSRVYVYQYLPFLEKDKIPYEVYNFGPHKINPYNNGIRRYLTAFLLYATVISKIIKVNVLVCFRSADTIFCQKVVLLPLAVRILKWRKKKIVYCMDDAVYLKVNILSIGIYKRKQFNQFLDNCHSIVVGSNHYSAILPAYKSKMIFVPNAVSINGSDGKMDKKPISIGWIGSRNTTKYLRMLLGIFEKLNRNLAGGVQVVLIGADKDKLKEHPWITYYDWDLEREKELLKKVDIGIMPLENTEWERGKCGYKLIQYFSMGIPAVASPVGINVDLVNNSQAGFLCNSENDWYDKLQLLIDDDELRKKLGTKAKEYVVQHHNVEHVYSNKYRNILINEEYD